MSESSLPMSGSVSSLSVGLRESTVSSHPLEKSTLEWEKRAHADEMKLLERCMGKHMVFRLQMEQKAVENIGHLPFMDTRSNMMSDLLLNHDELLLDNATAMPKESLSKDEKEQPHEVVEAALARANI